MDRIKHLLRRRGCTVPLQLAPLVCDLPPPAGVTRISGERDCVPCVAGQGWMAREHVAITISPLSTSKWLTLTICVGKYTLHQCTSAPPISYPGSPKIQGGDVTYDT